MALVVQARNDWIDPIDFMKTPAIFQVDLG